MLIQQPAGMVGALVLPCCLAACFEPPMSGLSSAFIQVRPLATNLLIGDTDGCLKISAGTLGTFHGCQKVLYATSSSNLHSDYGCLIKLDLCMSLAVSELSHLQSLQLDVAMKHER